MPSLNLRQVASAYLKSIVFWLGMSLLMGWQYRNQWTSIGDLLVTAVAHAFALALWTPPIFYMVGRYLRYSTKRIRYFVLWGLSAVPFVLLQLSIQLLLIPPYDDVQHKYLPRSFDSLVAMIRGAFADVIFIYIAIVVAAHAHEYFQRARKQELEASEFQRALAMSELQALKMQLHPHFLFNTLHGISTLVSSDPVRARAMIVKLSNLLRTALHQTDSDLIPFSEELKFVREYLDLEKMRLGARLTTTLEIPSDTLALLVPPLILQPLVENGIRHGIESSREPGWIEVTSRRNGESLEIRVRNNVGEKGPADVGVGLHNTQARLKHLYADEASFSLDFQEDGTVVATMALPVLGKDQQSHETGSKELESKVEDNASINRR